MSCRDRGRKKQSLNVYIVVNVFRLKVVTRNQKELGRGLVDDGLVESVVATVKEETKDVKISL